MTNVKEEKGGTVTATTTTTSANTTTNVGVQDSGTDETLLPTPGCFKNVSDRVLKARAKLVDSPYDLEAWNILIKDFQTKPIEQAREFYEQLVSQFPTCGRYWKFYIEHEMKSRNFEKVEKLFQRCLVKVLNIDLWKCYLNYIKEAKFHLPSFREKMGQAFDFALEKMGIDMNSYSIYNDYVQFLKSVEAQGSYAENQKISAVRRVYQRGIVIPMSHIETFWKEYLAYEQSINQMFVDKAIADRSKDYMNARRVAKEIEAMTRGLNRNAPAVPPRSVTEEIRQVELWKRFIQWEKDNPLKTEDLTLVIKRVVFAYEQCLLCLGHHPDIWYEYASFLEEHSRILAEKGDMNHHKALLEDVASVYERAITGLLKENVLLHFSYADFEESRNKKAEAVKIYEKLLKIKGMDFNPTLTYIQYMKFTRRCESITSARAIFKRAREDTRSGYEIYIAAAMMEYYCSKDLNIACKIFELGLKKFLHEANFILAYIDFLGHLNEENNIRVLFERVLSSESLPLEKSLEIWNKFLEFESHIGDLASLLKVEKRRYQVIEKLQKNHSSKTSWLVDRYRFLGLMPCNTEELRSIGYHLNVPSGSIPVGQNNYSPQKPNQNRNQPRNQRDQLTLQQFFSKKKNLHNLPKQNVAIPNLSQMVPYKPVPNPVNNLMPGGVFPYPPSITTLLSQLPPPLSFRGPFVNVDELMNIFKSSTVIDLSEGQKANFLIPTEAKSYFAVALDSTDPFNQQHNQHHHHQSSNKRPMMDDDDDGEDSNLMPPQFDLYRTRQLQKKPKKTEF